MAAYYTAAEITPGIYHIYENSNVCCTLITGANAALLIDTGYGFSDLAGFLQRLTTLPLVILNTHGHLDHTGGNFQFASPAWMHPAEQDVYDLYQQDKASMLSFLQKRFLAGKISNPFPAHFEEDAYFTYKAVPFLPACDGQQIDLGDRMVQIIALPGHSKGSLAVFDDQSGTLVSGDSIDRSLWMMFAHSAPPETLCAALYQLKKRFPVGRILASHAKTPYPPQMIDAVINAIRHRNPDTDSIFIHPRHGYQALHHKEPITGIAGVSQIHLVYPLPHEENTPVP